jgi:hypothetical protein
MLIHNLTTEQMMIVGETFVDSFQFVISNYLPDSKISIKQFITELVLKNKSYMLVSHEGVPYASNLIFSDESHRDFIMTLHFTFFARWGHLDKDVDGLISNLARGASMMNVRQLNAMPSDINTRLTDIETTKSLLDANRWLIVILLIMLFISADPTNTKQPT